MIKGKTPEEIRKLFNIVNDFTPEEEAQIKKENVRASPSCRLCRIVLTTCPFRNGLRTDERQPLSRVRPLVVCRMFVCKT
jgi:hypothetical protein